MHLPAASLFIILREPLIGGNWCNCWGMARADLLFSRILRTKDLPSDPSVATWNRLIRSILLH